MSSSIAVKVVKHSPTNTSYGKVGDYPSIDGDSKPYSHANGYIIYKIHSCTSGDGMAAARTDVYSVDNYGTVFRSTNGLRATRLRRGYDKPLSNACINAVKHILDTNVPGNLLDFYPLLSVYVELDATRIKLKTAEEDLAIKRPLLETRTAELAASQSEVVRLRRVELANQASIDSCHVEVALLKSQLEASQMETALLKSQLEIHERDIVRLKPFEEAHMRAVAVEQRMVERMRLATNVVEGPPSPTEAVALEGPPSPAEAVALEGPPSPAEAVALEGPPSPALALEGPPINVVESTAAKLTKCRNKDTSKCFTNGQRIRHRAGTDNVWYAYYDATQDKFIYEGIPYSLNGFTTKHYVDTRPDRETPKNNAWAECEYDVNGTWVSTEAIMF